MKTSKNIISNYITESQSLMDRLQSDERGFEKISQIIKDKAGINMIKNSKNITLMASRLSSVLKKHSLLNYKDYLKLLATDDSDIILELISSLTTNTTHFFRESSHFDAFKSKINEFVEQKMKTHQYTFRIWCAASSTGQEIYTMLMVLLNQIPNYSNWDIKFLATDIDVEVLQKAADGIYQESEMENVPELYRQQYFTKNNQFYHIKSEFRNLIRFAPFNLITEKYPFQHPFDFIFCRNVLIYFDRETAGSVIDKLGKSLRSNGCLFLGHSETGMMRSKFLKTISNGVYQRIGG